MNLLNVSVYASSAFALGAVILSGQVDPGPRGGAPGAGSYYATLSANEQNMFAQALVRFQEIDSVSGSVAGEPGLGLGPTFNGNSCTMCHAQPAIGGSSPGLRSPQKSAPNPQVALAHLDGATNTVPSFITADGPVREARFVSANPGSSGAPLDGGVHGLFTIQGRSDAPGCTLAQPDFAAQLNAHNVIFRIPTPLFGLGLVESTPDATLLANLAATESQRSALGITGRFNHSGNDGTITRFGWKAQNKSLLLFVGEAYNVEQGVSNELFPNERSAVTGCIFNGTPEDGTNLTNPANPASTTGTASEMSSDIVNFAAFIRMLAPAAATTATPSEQNGRSLFTTVGCSLCHSPTLTSGKATSASVNNITYHPYSDFALHHMGETLADGIVQAAAGPDEFRTAPLWGLGQRLFFLHDGRTSDLLGAIRAHASAAGGCMSRPGETTSNTTCTSEANQVVQQFNALSSSQQQDIVNFLRSL